MNCTICNEFDDADTIPSFNPPVLTFALDDGEVLTESEAIKTYFDKLACLKEANNCGSQRVTMRDT
jgi:hypothetical protein